MNVATTTQPPRGNEAGFAGGTETIPFGIVVFIAATLLLANVWAAFDTRGTLDNAARDYLRAYTAAMTRAEAETAGADAAAVALGDRVVDHTIRAPEEAFGPCRAVTVEIEATLPAVRLPFVGGLGTQTIRTTQRELIQPYRGASDERPGLGPTVCDG